MLFKSTLVIIFVLCYGLCIHIPKDDPFRNRTIIKALAAYYQIGIQRSNGQSSEFVYIKSMSFQSVFSQFIGKFLQQTVKVNRQNVPFQRGFVHFGSLLKTLMRTGCKQSPQDQNRLATELTSVLDQIYQSIFKKKTDDPNQYFFVLGNIAFLPMDKTVNEYRKVFKMLPLEKLHHSYQYFNLRAKHVNSQFDQDGVIEAIFNLIGTRNKEYVEIGGGNYYDNSYQLRTKKGWKGILFNGGVSITDRSGRDSLKIEFVTPQRGIEVFKKYNVRKDLDFLSVDIDGNDFWVTQELLRQYRPAVVSAQFNANFPATVAASLRNCQTKFGWNVNGKIYGASAQAFYNLGKANGYSYVYHMTFTDIFLVRDDLLPKQFKGMKLEDTYDAFPIHFLDANMNEYFQTFNLLQTSFKICPTQTISRQSQQEDNSNLKLWILFATILVIIVVLILKANQQKQELRSQKIKHQSLDEVNNKLNQITKSSTNSL